jgi:hypothetical protein
MECRPLAGELKCCVMLNSVAQLDLHRWTISLQNMQGLRLLTNGLPPLLHPIPLCLRQELMDNSRLLTHEPKHEYYATGWKTCFVYDITIRT